MNEPSRPRYPRPRSWYPPQTARSAAPSATAWLEGRGFLGQVGCDQCLLAILAASDVEQIERSGLQLSPDSDRLDDELVTAQGCAASEHGDVPAVGIDVEVLGVEMADSDRHVVPSQYGRTYPRSVRTPRKESIAV